MRDIKQSLTELIGHTPLLELNRLAAAKGAKARVVAKLECFNPGGSVKDRVALAILRPGATIIEPTSGNTGVGLAWVARLKGYRTILTMPETMSLERRALLRAMGARIELTPGAEGMNGAIRRAEELRGKIEGAVILGQFTNPANPAAHERTTAEEIWSDTAGEVALFVAGAGTGGTISGTGRGLKAHNPAIRVVAVEPDRSAVLSGDRPGPHGLQGIGAGFIPATYDATTVDQVIRVTDEAAYEMTRSLAAYEGLLVGISSGAAAHAALTLACQEEYAGRMIVVLLPDTGERYLSTGVFGE